MRVTFVTSKEIERHSIFEMGNFTRWNRRSCRLPGHDYAGSGSYFVTLCVKNRECLFGNVAAGRVQLNTFGRIVHDEWLRTTEIRKEITLDVFVVMPNHLHGILVIKDQQDGPAGTDQPHAGAHGRTPLRGPSLHRAPRSLGSFVAGFKSITAKQINKTRNTPGLPVWQRNYQEWIIRDDGMLNRIQAYTKQIQRDGNVRIFPNRD